MIVPLYFINKKEVESIQHAIEIHKHISSEYEKTLEDVESEEIISKLKSRQYLDKTELMKIISVLVLVVVGVESINSEYSIDLKTAKESIVKLITLHKDQLEDEDYVDNMIMFRYAYNVLKTSKNNLSLNNSEEKTYNYLELLQM